MLLAPPAYFGGCFKTRLHLRTSFCDISVLFLFTRILFRVGNAIIMIMALSSLRYPIIFFCLLTYCALRDLALMHYTALFLHYRVVKD